MTGDRTGQQPDGPYGPDAARRLERAGVVLDDLIALQLEQGSTNFLPDFREVRRLAGSSDDPQVALATMWSVYLPSTRGGMGSVNDLVFWLDDVDERRAVNRRWEALRHELWDLLAPPD